MNGTSTDAQENSVCSNITTSWEYTSLQTTTASIAEYYIWIICAFGFPGNLLSIFAIWKMSRQHLTTSLFLVGLLAIVDNVAIVLKVIENRSRYDNFVMTPGSCKALFFLGLTFAVYANWILVALALERYIAVCYPLKVSILWSFKKAVMIVFGVFVFLCGAHCHLLWTLTDYEGYACQLLLHGVNFKVWFYVSACLYAVLPASCLFVFNILIILRVKTSTHRRENLSEYPARNALARRQDRQVTMMLITVAAVFLLLSFPRCLFLVTYDYWKPEECTLAHAQKQFLDILSNNIADSNHAVNFYLYVLAGKRFRQAYQCTKRLNTSSSVQLLEKTHTQTTKSV